MNASNPGMSPAPAAASLVGGQGRQHELFLLPEVEAALADRRLATGMEVRPAIEAIRARADWLLNEGPWCIPDKTYIAPSGDPRDYLSLSIYYNPILARPTDCPMSRSMAGSIPRSSCTTTPACSARPRRCRR